MLISLRRYSATACGAVFSSYLSEVVFLDTRHCQSLILLSASLLDRRPAFSENFFRIWSYIVTKCDGQTDRWPTRRTAQRSVVTLDSELLRYENITTLRDGEKPADESSTVNQSRSYYKQK